MNVEAALGAARRLSVDVANLTYRLAQAEAVEDVIREAMGTIEPDLWQRRAVDDGTPGAGSYAEIVLTEEQVQAVVQLLTTLRQVL